MRTRINLNEEWRFRSEAPDGVEEAEDASSAWRTLSLPGDINAALVRDGVIPDPHIGANGREAYWISSKVWLLERQFRYDGESKHLDLCLDGVDGPAEIFLNGECLGTVRNAFHPHRFAIEDRIKERNTLTIRFLCLEKELGSERVDELAGWPKRRVLLRKPQFNFGWDWALPLPSIGIMGGVWLEAHDGARIRDLAIDARLDGRVDIKLDVSAAAKVGCSLELSIRGHGYESTRSVELSSCRSYLSIQVPDPKLWWPNGMGEAALYEYSARLLRNSEALDTRSGRFAFRKVEIDEAPFTEDAGSGMSFWLKINGRRVFCKGGNWIPLELWPAEVRDEQYRFYLGKAADAHFNMLRVWGGGIYERDIFYDLCDQLGIMVWQDFMFASAGYPEDVLRPFVIREAEYQIRRLRNRPSVVLWCGCNEDVFSWSAKTAENDGDYHTDEMPVPDDGFHVDRMRDDPRLYTMLLRGLVSKHGQGVPYVESSPMSHDDQGNSYQSGNAHLSSWKYALFQTDGKPRRFREHFERAISFDSEFCIQGPCSEETLRRFLTSEHAWPPDDVWIYHIQRGHADLPHYEQTMTIAGDIFGEITDLQTYVKHGQATHVEMMRAEFESARRDRPNNGGTMMWMFNDCWPTSNWSIIDFYRIPKPSYYAAKRACHPVLPIVMERKGVIEFFMSNDGPKPVSVHARWGRQRLDGTILVDEETDLEVGAMSSTRFARMDRDCGADEFFFISASADGKRLSTVTHFSNGWRDVPWPEPGFDVRILDSIRSGSRHRTSVEVKAETYLRLFHFDLPEHCWLDDNDFDLPKGDTHTVTIESAKPLAAEELACRTWNSETRLGSTCCIRGELVGSEA